MHHETITYQVDGLQMVSRLYFDAGRQGLRPGVLVFPEGFGLGEHAKTSAVHLAELGYVVLACDIHGNGMEYNMADVMTVIASFRNDHQRIRARAQGGLDALLRRAEVDSGRLAAIGFCFGGTMALELARAGAPLSAVVGFHSGLATAAPASPKSIKGRVLVCLGADDPGIPPEQRAAFEREMRDAGVDWRMNLYGGVVHGFTNPAIDALGLPERLRYDAEADRHSWADMCALFEQQFGRDQSAS